MELPIEFQERMQRLLGEEEYSAYLKSFSRAAHSALRVNTGKISVEEFRELTGWKLWPVPWVANGFYYEDVSHPAKHPHYYAGLYYLQEPSAMTPASRLPVRKGDRILDLCAAPGGKATELAARLGNTGMLLANDISHSRAKALLKNLEMQGAENILVTSEDPERLAALYPETFDGILLDAPCSGEGMFRKEKSMIEYWKEHGPEYYVPIQRKLIRQAERMLRPGGYLLYSTCTFSTEENEGVIEEFLSEYPDMELCPVTPYQGFSPGVSEGEADLSECVHIFPHRMEGEGHFLALLRKKGEQDGYGTVRRQSPELSGIERAENSSGKSFEEKTGKTAENPERKKEKNRRPDRRKKQGEKKAGEILSESAKEFLSHVRREFLEERFFVQDDQLYYLAPGLEPALGLRYLRTGLWIGTEKSGRFEPSQAFAMTLTPETFDTVLELTKEDERILRYLKGETISVEDGELTGKKGWVLICEEGFALGFGKITGGTIKNKYYAGWRMV